jgi:ParB family chromosome partitioning protein
MKQRVFAPVPEPEKAKVKNKLGVRIPTQSLPTRDTAPPSSEMSQPTSGAPEIKPHEGDYIVIDARLVDQNRYPPRQLYHDDAIKIIADSIRDNGQRDAIHVMPHPDKPGRFIVGDGWTRVQAIRSYSINEYKILARIHQGTSEREISWLGFDQNEQRSEQTDYDRAMFFISQKANGAQWDEIAEKSGISKSRMSHFAAYEKLPAQLSYLVKMNTAKLSARAAYFLSQAVANHGEEVAERLAQRFVDEDRPQSWLESQAGKDSSEKIKPDADKKARLPKVTFQKALGDGGYVRQRANGQVELVLKAAEDRSAELLKAIQQVIQNFE